MSAAGKPRASGTSRVLRWLLGGQIALAVLLVGLDLGPYIPGMLAPPRAPELDQPTRPGDQTRRYRPRTPASPGPGTGGDMPRRLLAAPTTIDGAEALSLRGAIAPGDAERISAELDDIRPAIVSLDSPGGSVMDALALGRVLRDLDIDTRLEAGAVCLSACPYAFVGGTARHVADTARVGVHQHSFGSSAMVPAFLAVADIQRGQAEVLAHLDDMGVDLRLMGPAMATPANAIYILSPDELRDWNVVAD
ncbi:COG3904 family protein [Meridianimarinicoccus sp. RP-17]|uniref:COG3904 family protein n=1 Tax=Meridianimarinicoccus zhengii TaxID=2056810 RepID=UPI000DAF3974|nr:hypothetical protein [Phycocomes zhengii]